MTEGVAGLLREKSRPPGIAPLPAETVDQVLSLTGAPPPGEATHWTVRAMAKAVGISRASVQRIWQAHGLQPHRLKAFKLSRDPAFAAKLRDIVGLYVDPPAHAVVPRSTRSRRFRRSTAPSPDCRSSRAGSAP